MRIMRLIALTILLWPGTALAQAANGGKGKSFAELYPPLPGVEYYCTDGNGQRVELGGVTCVTASCQTWMARCEMASSNRMAMWRKTQDGCPGADAGELLTRIGALRAAL